jgi:hypothetical protein
VRGTQRDARLGGNLLERRLRASHDELGRTPPAVQTGQRTQPPSEPTCPLNRGFSAVERRIAAMNPTATGAPGTRPTPPNHPRSLDSPPRRQPICPWVQMIAMYTGCTGQWWGWGIPPPAGSSAENLQLSSTDGIFDRRTAPGDQIDNPAM